MSFDDPQTLLWLRRTATALVLPPTGPLLLALTGLLLLPLARRLALLLVWMGVLGGLLLNSPIFVELLIEPLETTPPPTAAQRASAQAIVVIGAGKRARAPEYGGSTLSPQALERLRYGALLARQSGLPLMLSGGSPGEAQPEADLMKLIARDEYGVTARWVESASNDTRENARFSAAILSGAGVRRVLLVTHAAHMPRARREFEQAGLEVVPAPTAWLSAPGVVRWLPDSQSIYAGWFASREWLAQLVAPLRGDAE